MGQLVADDVIGFLERCPGGQDDAALETLGHAARTFARLLPKHVGLLKIRGVRVENERLPAAQLVAQNSRQSRVPPFRHAAGFGRHIRFLIIEVDIEVLGLENLEVERLILNGVAAEILRVGGDTE